MPVSTVNQTVTQTASSGVSFGSLLTLVFVIAKLAGHFHYSWWIVFLPIWAPAALIFVVIVTALLILGLAYLLDKKDSTKRKRSSF